MNSRCLLARTPLLVALFSLSSFTQALAAENPEAGEQVEQTLAHTDGDVGYLLYLPADYDQDDSKSWPVVLFLHGRGESNGPLSLVAKWGPPRFAARGDDLPFILVSPQCPRDGRWSDDVRQAQIDALLDHITQSFRVDEERVYVTGLSMGGYGSWTLAARTPQRFAAVVPVCGGGNPDDADKLKSLPIWVFHGDQDLAVPYSRSVEMVDAIRAAGSSSIRFTSMEHIGHNCWSATYATPELYSWLLKQRNK